MSPSRIIVRAALEPITGSRFQPTGFPDLGAAIFERPLAGGGTERCLLVESNQSMANRLEGVAWDLGTDVPVPLLAALPWVRVSAADEEGRYLTSSRTESHRLASAFVKTSKTTSGTLMVKEIHERLGLRDDTPLSPSAIAEAIFRLDPLCLIHGVFFADKEWPGQPKVTRALTASIEARGIYEAVSGGVKRDQVRHSLNDKDEGGTKEGYGSVPFSRVEYTAREIEATFVLDLALLDSFGLPGPARDLLEAIALWEIRTLLDGGLRLRTACDLALAEEPTVVVKPGSGIGALPSVAELEGRISEAIAGCGDLISDTVPMEVSWSGKKG